MAGELDFAKTPEQIAAEQKQQQSDAEAAGKKKRLVLEVTKHDPKFENLKSLDLIELSGNHVSVRAVDGSGRVCAKNFTKDQVEGVKFDQDIPLPPKKEV